MHTEQAIYLQLFLFLAFLIPLIGFLLTQFQTLRLIRPQYRRLHPGQVWFQLIPLFGLIWQFFVIARLSESIRNQLSAALDNSIFSSQDVVPTRPTYRLGMSYAVLFCIVAVPIPFLKVIAALLALVLWIAYWIELNRYKKKIKALVLVAS